MSPAEALNKAARIVGSKDKLAKQLGLAHGGVIAMWLVRGVPAERAPEIERITGELGDRVPCELLRPDVNWGVLRQSAAPELSVATPTAATA
jgi:DNA-binding transcriptional regulator YdaS (Cro superfamily)